MSEPVRLSRHVSTLMSCSRREAELLIEGGWVSVDGQVIEQPQFKISGQQVVVAPDARPEPVPPATLLLHKPAGIACTPEQLHAGLTLANRFMDDNSRIRHLHRHTVRLDCPLALDADSSGLVVLTQDWRVRRHLTEAATRLEQEYTLELAGPVSDEQLEHLNRPFHFQGSDTTARVSRQSDTRLRLVTKAPLPGQLAALCQTAALPLKSLRRLRIGRLSLARLPEGQWRYLAGYERF